MIKPMALHSYSGFADAKEIIAYNMPGFQIEKIIAAGHAAFSRQCGPYVAPGAISSLADNIEAAGLEATKTGVKFSKKKANAG